MNNEVRDIISSAVYFAHASKDEYLTPEHILYIILKETNRGELITKCGGDLRSILHELEIYIKKEIPKKSTDKLSEPSEQLNIILTAAQQHATNAGKKNFSLEDVLVQIFDSETYASYFLKKYGVTRMDLLK